MQAALSVTRCFARTFVTSVARVQPRPRSSTQLVSAACGFPKDLAYGRSTVQKMDVFGDDALFVARHRSADVMGVADGVGGWHNYGVDPSVFSSSLMRTCARLVEEGRFNPENPANLLAASYRSLMRRYQETSNKKTMQGSSTACVVVLDRAKNAIYTANLGDSGFLVVRDGKVVHRSEEQQHYFNAPFQLSLPPNEESVQFLSDRPEAAAITSFRVEEGDLILLATDGLFDNLPAHLIENELKQFRADDEKSIQRVCNSLALQARRLAFDQDFVSPFAQKAQKHGITDCIGGKPDDITIILAVVTSVQEESVAGENSENKN